MRSLDENGAAGLPKKGADSLEIIGRFTLATKRVKEPILCCAGCRDMNTRILANRAHIVRMVEVRQGGAYPGP